MTRYAIHVARTDGEPYCTQVIIEQDAQLRARQASTSCVHMPVHVTTVASVHTTVP